MQIWPNSRLLSQKLSKPHIFHAKFRFKIRQTPGNLLMTLQLQLKTNPKTLAHLTQLERLKNCKWNEMNAMNKKEGFWRLWKFFFVETENAVFDDKFSEVEFFLIITFF